ncbi:MAG: transporter, family, tetracycline resistance protein [Pyrinomonadaceae bacterium]|jgi:DHA1 family tetracycline resistance protein-like MFS transporter|nr:transporter, family, tetracycline resistance protein [Pyrinomonadaceae bacterium]
MKRSPLVVIFTTVFIDLVGFGIVIPVLPFYAEGTRFNATPRTVGFLFASYSIMQLIFSPILGRLSDKHGRRPVLLISIIGTGIGFLILGFATTLWMLFVGRILDGITGGNISTAQAYIADITTKEERAKGMGLLGAAFGLGFIFGPAIGGILSQWGVAVPFLFAAGLCFANATLLYFTLPETVTADHPARTSAAGGRGLSQLIQSLRQPRLGFVLIVYFMFIVAFSIMTTTFSLYTMFRFGYDAKHNGYLFAYVGVLAVIIQGGLIGRLVKRFGELPLVIVGALFFAASLFAIPFVGPNAGGLLALLIGGGIFSAGNSLATPSLTSLASKTAGRGEQGGVLGVTQSVASLARAVGPALAAFLIHSTIAYQGADGKSHFMSDRSLFLTFWTGAGIMFLAFLLAVYFTRVHSSDYSEESVAEAA